MITDTILGLLLGVLLLSAGARPAGAAVYTGAGCVFLPSHVGHHDQNRGLGNMNASTGRQLYSIACRLMVYFTERRTQRGMLQKYEDTREQQ